MNVIIDGNLELFKALHIVSDFGKRRFMETVDDEIDYAKRFLTDIASIAGMFKHMDRLIIVFDEKNSWRKDVYEMYKSNRNKDMNHVNWNRFFSVVNEIIGLLRHKNINILQFPRTEGDDIMFLLSEYFSKNNESSILVTTDKDLYQCVEFGKDRYTIMYSGMGTSKKIVTTSEFTSWLQTPQPMNLFESSTFSNTSQYNILNSLLRESNLALHEINPMQCVFKKVLSGDRGDNIQPVAKWSAKTDITKTRGVTEKKAEMVWDMLPTTIKSLPLDLYSDSDIDVVSQAIIDICKCPVDKKTISKNIRNNIHLIFLSRKFIPVNISSEFDKTVHSIIDNYNSNVIYEYIIHGTRFSLPKTKESIPKEFNPFNF